MGLVIVALYLKGSACTIANKNETVAVNSAVTEEQKAVHGEYVPMSTTNWSVSWLATWVWLVPSCISFRNVWGCYQNIKAKD